MRLPGRQRAVWQEWSRVLRSHELQETFKAKFRVALKRRFRRPVCDSLSKAVTVQFYLPPDDTQSTVGTIFLEGRTGEAALRTRRLPLRPATGYAFPVIYHESWHSVARTSEPDGQRDSLMLTYDVQDAAPRWLLARLKRVWSFLVYDLHR